VGKKALRNYRKRLYICAMQNAIKYTEAQIAKAKAKYSDFMQIRSVQSFEPQYIGWATAEQRCEYHNNIVNSIIAGDKELEKYWKMFFIKEVLVAERKQAERDAKLAANKSASADVLLPIKQAKRLVEFGKWLNTPGNPFRKEHFSKKYTQASVSAFLNN
jgi:hypothetical protein